MGTKKNPGKYDCYANAEPNEPIFVLRANDVHAPIIVRVWVWRMMTKGGDEIDLDKVAEALACAEAMEKWRKENRQ